MPAHLREQTLTHEPIRLGGRLPVAPLLDERAENVRVGLVQRAGLTAVVEVGGVLGHAVGQFVADDIQRQREAVEQLSIPVAVHHLPAVPEGIVVGPLIVHGRIQPHTVPVERVALIDSQKRS